MALTESQIRSAKPQGKRYRLTDGGGLVVHVTPAGKKVWRFRYQRAGKDTAATVGAYPVMTLLEARARALDLKRAGDGPMIQIARDAERKRTVTDETFEVIAAAFLAREKQHWADGHYKRFYNRMKIDVFPVLGAMYPRDIKPIDVTRAIAVIEGRGAQDTAIRTVGMIGQVLRYSVAKGLADQDVTQHLKGGLDRPPPTKHRPAVLDRVDLGRLLVDVWDWAGDSYGKSILQLAAYLFQRPGEIRAMRWADVDLNRAVWTYTVSKVGINHAVPLPRQAIEILTELRRGTGRFQFVFYSHRAIAGYVSEQAALTLLNKIGWRNRQSVHGFRATARTLIAEDLGVEPRLIEQQLSHTVPEAHGRAYNRTLHLPERREMLQRYADHLDGLREAQT